MLLDDSSDLMVLLEPADSIDLLMVLEQSVDARVDILHEASYDMLSSSIVDHVPSVRLGPSAAPSSSPSGRESSSRKKNVMDANGALWL